MARAICGGGRMNKFHYIKNLIKLKKQVHILKHANTELKSKLALQKKYNYSNLRMIDRLRCENIELIRELRKKEHIEFFYVPKRCAHIISNFEPIFETRESVITNEGKVYVFDSLLAKGFIRKIREENNFVIYELCFKSGVEE